MLTERWGSVGFRLDDPTAPRECRRAAARMLEVFGLTQFADVASDVLVMVSELVTNAQRHAGNAYPAGSFTLWHPGRSLFLTVHDKGRRIPWRETHRAMRYRPTSFAWGAHDMEDPAHAWEPDGETGRGLQLVHALALQHCGEFWWERDWDQENPGKVACVRLLLPNVLWRNELRGQGET